MHAVTFLMVVLNALAVFRLAVLTTTDQITARPRNWLNTNYTGSLVYLINCNWCVSVWYGAGAAALTYFFWPVWQWIALALTCSAVAGFLGERS